MCGDNRGGERKGGVVRGTTYNGGRWWEKASFLEGFQVSSARPSGRTAMKGK